MGSLFILLGHGYEVDVWSLGCILYTLLVGKPPFETQSLKDTYSKIRKNEYSIPENRISRESALIIQRCLKHDPNERPTMAEIASDPFFAGFTPESLPTSVCTTAPRFGPIPLPNQVKQAPIMINANKPTHAPMHSQQRRPFTEQQQNEQILIASRHQQVMTLPTPILMNERSNEIHGLGPRVGSGVPNQTDMALTTQMSRQLAGLDSQPFVPQSASNEEINDDLHLAIDLQRQLDHLIQLKPNEKTDKHEDDAEDPASAPMLWISKWVDYSDKYGLGYQLCDDSVGVLFNDSTRLIMTAGGAENLQYIDREGYEHLCTMKDYPDQLKKKVTLLKVIVLKIDHSMNLIALFCSTLLLIWTNIS